MVIHDINNIYIYKQPPGFFVGQCSFRPVLYYSNTFWKTRIYSLSSLSPCLSVANGSLDSFTSPKTCGANGSNGNPAQCRCTAIARAQDLCGLISPARKPVMNWAMRKLELLLAQLPWTKSWFQRRKLPALIGILLPSKIVWYDRVTMEVEKVKEFWWRSSNHDW